jgi:hypothetical protein
MGSMNAVKRRPALGDPFRTTHAMIQRGQDDEGVVGLVHQPLRPTALMPSATCVQTMDVVECAVESRDAETADESRRVTR